MGMDAESLALLINHHPQQVCVCMHMRMGLCVHVCNHGETHRPPACANMLGEHCPEPQAKRKEWKNKDGAREWERMKGGLGCRGLGRIKEEGKK